MGWDIAYATEDAYKVERKIVGTVQDAGIQRDLKAIARIIDMRTGRKFGVSDSLEPRLYYPNKQSYGPRTYGLRPVGWAESENPWRWAGAMRIVEIDDFFDTADMVIIVDEMGRGDFNYTPLDKTQLEFIPLNAVAYGKPYTAISVPDWSSIGAFAANKRIQVSTIWGWPTVPDAIVRANIDLTAILRMESPRATRTMNEINQVLSTTPAANNILSELVRDYSRKTGLTR